ncbi:MAG TPA: endolytic transglycosylase MltG [Bacillota bacterium]|nr:endolytic transglycosylase MltG [Bacillota bacterium]
MLQKNTSWGPNHKFNLTNQHNPLVNHPRFEGGLVISVLSIFSLLVLYFVWNLAPVEPGSRTNHVFEVPYGASLRQVGQALEKQGIIRSKFVFEIYVRLNPGKRMTKAGQYRVSPGMSVPTVVGELVRGKPQSIRITIPEGLTLKETAALLAGKGLVNADEFIKLATDSNFVNQVFTSLQVENGAEGYLFPDTYEFALNVTATEIVTQMLKQFEKVYQKHFGAIPEANQREIVTLASIIEKEAKHADERPVIAGVFYNRLRRDFPLQSCATVQYALGEHKKRLLYKDLQVKSPYNTYMNSGLPPGPIASPGLDSLKAAAFPLDVSYLFFVAKPNGSHVFSNTYAEHMRAQKEIGMEQTNDLDPGASSPTKKRW